MSDTDDVIAFFAEAYHDKDFRKIRPGRAGLIVNGAVQHPMLNADGTNAPAGKMHVRDKEDGDRGEALATIGMVDARIPDASIMLGELIPGGELVAYRPNYSDRALAAWGGNLAAIGMPYKPADMQIDELRTNSLDEGRIRPSKLYPSGGTLNVYIEPFWYNGQRYGDAEHDVGSANVPTGADEMCWAIIALDPSDGSFSTYVGTTTTYSNPDDMPIVNPTYGLTSIVIPGGLVPLAPPLLLIEDQTEITAANIQYTASRFEDTRHWLNAVGTVAVDTTGAADGDVPTWNATDGIWEAATPSGGGGGGLGDYILIRDQKTQNTAGGTFTSGARRQRDLTAEVVDAGGHASLSGNRVDLAAGTYITRISCPAFAVGRHQAYLYNFTDSVDILIGETAYAMPVVSGFAAYSRSEVIGQFTLASTKTLEIQHQCETTRSGSGFGQEANFATEVYTVAEFWKIA